MRVLVTGANGFIGSHITAHLIAAGHDVVAIVRRPPSFLARFPGQSAHAGNLELMTAEADWAPLLDGVEAVVNCAGLLQASDEVLDRVHHRAPAALFAAATARGIRRIVQISAVGIDADTGFARSKRAGDEALRQLDAEWTVLRPSLVYGSEAYGGTAMLRALAAFPFVIPSIGWGKQQFTPIRVEDLAECVTVALTTDRMVRQTVEPCGPETLDLADLLRGWRGWLGLKRAPILPVPRLLVAGLCRVGDLLGRGPVRTTALRQIEHGNAADPEAFRKLAGFDPMAFRKALSTQPAGTAALWYARLYLVRPLVMLSLAIMWIGSGIVGLTASPGEVWPLLRILPVPPQYSLAASTTGSLANIMVGITVLFSRLPQHVFRLQAIFIIGYTLLFTFAAPRLWIDIFSPLLKNIPILALAWVNRVLQEER